ncbi:hypothetical protein QE357_002588 [Siphonobacter sp. BAB-5404]|nr:hypothetical protein [Siphonobacter sp. SORGH_AS_1065]MDR6195536.1 hypothetical protein [Siphonobacter sp. SORGH_AS_0500]
MEFKILILCIYIYEYFDLKNAGNLKKYRIVGLRYGKYHKNVLF